MEGAVASDSSKPSAGPTPTSPPMPSAAGNGDGSGGWGSGAAGEEWREVYKGKELCCDVASLSVGVSYKFRVAASNAMGMGPWGDEKLYTSRAVAPEVNYRGFT